MAREISRIEPMLDEIMGKIYIIGDTHGDMNRIVRFCERMETSKEDIMIILGDVGLNYYGDSRDRRNKEKVANLPITLFCIHGNHERRPTTIAEYKLHVTIGLKMSNLLMR